MASTEGYSERRVCWGRWGGCEDGNRDEKDHRSGANLQEGMNRDAHRMCQTLSHAAETVY